jgi:hypothetical protein
MTENNDVKPENYMRIVAAFEQGLQLPEWRKRIDDTLKRYHILSYKQRVYYNFDKNLPVLDITPDDETFKQIVQGVKPKEIRYSGLVESEQNWDPKGRKGTMKFEADNQIVISSHQYIFGEEGVFEDYKKMGYSTEDRRNRKVTTDIEHFFVRS